MSSRGAEITVFSNLLASLCEEMGAVLRRSAYSPNVKDRRDYSCALFDGEGRLVAQAAHIPVHLGSMAYAVDAVRNMPDLHDRDVVMLNDPFLGGTHLPDVTLVTPVHEGKLPLVWLACRAHHSDVGGRHPGSMAVVESIDDEGIRMPPTLLLRKGRLRRAAFEGFCQASRTPRERAGDLRAQLAALRSGQHRVEELLRLHGPSGLKRSMEAVLRYCRRVMESTLEALPDGCWSFTDHLDDDGCGHAKLPISVTLRLHGNRAELDFEGTSPAVAGPVNAVFPVTVSAVLYAFRCLIPEELPANHGMLAPLSIRAPRGCLVHAQAPHAVSAGNVETSQRIVDTLFGALAQAVPQRCAAASCGSMNNVAMGGMDPRRGEAFSYYETVAGGMGAGPHGPGLSAVHTHMTNTLNTPIESLEAHYPLRCRRYALRRGSGGHGLHDGGCGVIKEIEVLAEATLSLLTERRSHAPWGLLGGEDGRRGRNRLRRDGRWRKLPSKVSMSLQAGDVLGLETPGGGGYGRPDGGNREK